MIADDLFAGAGGWDLAARELGIEARGVENMKEARATRAAAGLTTIHDDVWTFRPKYVARDGALVPIATGLIASPPCQTFSAAGKGNGRKALTVVQQLAPHVKDYSLKQLRRVATKATGDERTALVLTPLWFATHHPYRWLAWEQVPAVLPVWEACAAVLREQGFSVWTGLLQAEMYGVPQTRKRAFLLASRAHEVTPPAATHSRYHSRTPDRLDEGVKKWVSMAEGLSWDEDFTMVSNYGSGGDASKRGERHGSEPAPTVTSKIDRNQIRPDFLTPQNPRPNSANRTPDQPAPTMAFGHETPRWCWNRPATTVVGSFCPDVIAAPGYRTQVSRQNAPDSVRVTVQEAGVLQSFPADYPWQGAKGKQFLQCGNAVPPLLAIHALIAATAV